MHPEYAELFRAGLQIAAGIAAGLYAANRAAEKRMGETDRRLTTIEDALWGVERARTEGMSGDIRLLVRRTDEIHDAVTTLTAWVRQRSAVEDAVGPSPGPPPLPPRP